MAIPFSYNIVEIPNIEEIKEGLFIVKLGEALAVYSSFILRSLLYDPVLLDYLLIVIKKLRPWIRVNVDNQSQANQEKMVVSNNGVPHLSIVDYSVNSLLFKLDVPKRLRLVRSLLT